VRNCGTIVDSTSEEMPAPAGPEERVHLVEEDHHGHVVSRLFLGFLKDLADLPLGLAAHDPVGRRPVVAVAAYVVAADLRCAERGQPALHAERHQRAPAIVRGCSLNADLCGRHRAR